MGNHNFTAKAYSDCNKTSTSTSVIVKINAVVVTPQDDIIGASCGNPLQSLTYQVNPALKVNATSYNWFFRGAKQSLTVSADGSSCTVVPTKGEGQICVGIRYSTGTSYVQYCKTITSCSARTIQENTLSVYPNPSKNGQFSFALKTDSNVTMNIVDMLGNKVYSLSFKNDATSSKEFDLGKTEKGIYFLYIEHDGIVETSKLILE
ncbi:MAG: T9SS type A sorting domain-containing protein [Flavobacterium sp.]|nr:T9SS type A sorting domain-containing protein [Flavobacterium sp.]